MSAPLQSKRGRNPNVKYYDTYYYWRDAIIDFLFRIIYYTMVMLYLTWILSK